MTAAAWRVAVTEAAARAARGDPALLDLLAEALAQQEAAKEVLRVLGYGCLGAPWLDVVREIEVRRGEG